MKQRVATFASVFALIGGTGGAIAIGASGSHGASQGAATAQYKPGKGCGDKNHQHSGSKGKGKKGCPTPKKHHGATKGENSHKNSKNAHKKSTAHKNGVKGVTTTRHGPSSFTG